MTNSNGHGKLRVVIDALSARCGGGETYMRNLLEHFRGEPDLEVFVLTSDSSSSPPSNAFNAFTQIRVRRSVENPVLRAIWSGFILRRLLTRLQAQVLFSPGGVAVAGRPAGCKTVTMFRNMLPFDVYQRKRFPLGRERVRLWVLRRVLLRSMQKSDLVIFVSEFGRKVIEAESEGRLQDTIVIPHGVSSSFRERTKEHETSLANFLQGAYFLYVSSVAPHKSQIEVVHAYALLKQRRHTNEKLVFVGWEFPDYAKKVRREIRKLGLGDDVVMLGPVSSDELPWLYRHAVVNIFASQCENCPNILLEALAAGRPVVCSNHAPMPEFGGTAAIYFDPLCPEDLTEKLLSFLDRPDLLDDFGRRALERSLAFDWRKVTDYTWQAIVGLVQDHNHGKVS